MATEATIVAPAPSTLPKPGAPSAFPASTGEIKVGATGTTTTAATTPKPAPESSKGRMFKALEDKANGVKPAAPAPKPVEKPAEAAAAPAAEPGAEPAAKAAEPKAGEVQPDPAAAKDGKKPSPWKLVEDYKSRLLKSETELSELKKSGVPEEQRKSYEERLNKAETRAQELEKYLTYVDYSQTAEFKSTYVQPYEKAWSSAMSEIKDITITDPTSGAERAVTAQDMLQLVNASLPKARQLATEMFGEFANDVMNHRQKIRGLFDAQTEALEKAKNGGQEKLKQMQEQQTQQRTALTESIKKDWEAENKAVQTHEKYGIYFQPREGDEEWNSALEKGYSLVDKAFAENPSDPKLTPEQRKEVIRRHAATRNRAASWGPMRKQLERLNAQVKSLTEELGQYKELEPGSAGTRTPGANNATEGGSAKQKLMAELRKRAH